MVNEMGARAEGYKQLDEVIRQWKGEPGGLLPVMQQAQNIIGCVDEEVQNYIAEAMEVPVTDIYGIATFYSLFSLEPKGKYAVGLCLGTACYVKGAQAIGIGAGQQSRIHCTRLAGQKADNWYLRQNPKVLNLPFKEGVGRADRDNAIDLYIGDEYEDILNDWERVFTEKPSVFTTEEKKEWLAGNTDVTIGSDAFFPFGDNIERAHKSGVKYIAQPGGSVRDDNVIETANKRGMAMCFTGMRLFHH